MRTSLLLVVITAACGLGAQGGSSEPTLAEQAAFQAAVARVADAVVRIEPLPLSTASAAAEAAAGSGPSTGLIVAAGRVLTTTFAVPDDVDAAIVVLPDGGRRAARVRGRDASRGLVLLAVENLPEASPLEPVARAELRPGQWAIAVGRGWDAATPSPAVGIVSATNRAWGKAVQTDAAVSPMNYGGPLLDIAGRVIGVLAPLPADTAGMSAGTELYDAGIGFAVPLEDVLDVLPRLEQGSTLVPGILGIGYRSRDTINGDPLIASVRQGSPAAVAGLRPGDRIVRIDDRTVARIADARHAIAPRYAGDTLTIAVERGPDDARETIETTATLVAELPPWRRAVIGVTVARTEGDGAEPAGSGVAVAWVLPGGPADTGGLRPGDRIDSIVAGQGGIATPIDSPEAVAGALAGIAPGDEAQISFTRGGERATATCTTISLPADVPAEGPPREPPGGDPLAGPNDAVEVVRLEAADVADPALAVIPRGGGGDLDAVGVLVWCGPPHGRPAEAEATPWRAAAARHDVAVILPGSAAADAWSRDDIPAVTRALAALNTRRPIDPARIGIAGRDAGAAFAWLVADRLAAAAGGIALVDAPLPTRADLPPAAPGAARWILLGPGTDDATRERVTNDRARIERAGHAVGVLPADLGATPADLLCRWVSLLGLL